MWTAFTSANFAYFSKVLALAESFRHHHGDAPDRPKFVLVLNETREALETKLPSGSHPLIDRILCISELQERFQLSQSWIYSHSVVELCTAVKPYALKMLLEDSASPVMYLDPDTYVYQDLSVLVSSTQKGGIGLTPHLLIPAVTDEEVRNHEISCLKHGTFNLGFVVVHPNAEGLRFANWWMDRLLRYCHIDFLRGLFTDQKWMDLVPSFFPSSVILRHEGANCASWNLSTRRLTQAPNGQIFVNNVQPLLFFHYSGFNAGTHHQVSKRMSGGNVVIDAMTQRYIDRLEHFEDEKWRTVTWSLGRYQDGSPIREAERVLFRNRFLQFSNPTDDPFAWKAGQGCRRDFDRHIHLRGMTGVYPDGLSSEDLQNLSHRLIADLENIRSSFSYRVYQGLKRWKDQLRAPR